MLLGRVDFCGIFNWATKAYLGPKALLLIFILIKDLFALVPCFTHFGF